MKTFLIIISISFLTPDSFCQNITQIDSLTIEMCNSLSKLEDVEDKEKIMTIFKQHLPNAYKSFKVSSEKEADSLSDKIYYRLQHNCGLFRQILGRLEENKSDWKIIQEKPLSEITNQEFNTFKSISQFYYKEYDGSIVNVSINENIWLEKFEDGTFSKLIFIPKKNGEFDLKFIESNNETRKNFSNEGEIYNYGVYLKDENSYYVWVKSKDNTILSFKLYKKANR
jgi:hypothetical protein